MSLPSSLKSWTRQVLRQYGLPAGQARGQRFLVDRQVLRAIVAAAALGPADKVLEVGGGLGVLTLALAEHCRLVVTVELDRRLAFGLSKFLPTTPSLRVLEADILKVSERELLSALELESGERFSVVANLPYDISGAFLRRFLDPGWPLQQLVLLLQREVALRLVAPAGQMSLLSLLAQLSGQVCIIRPVPSSSFYPQPKVQSALVRLVPYATAERQQLLAGSDEAWLWRLARVGFAARRKQLKHNLLAALPVDVKVVEEALKQVGLSIQCRAQELGVEQWVELAKILVVEDT